MIGVGRVGPCLAAGSAEAVDEDDIRYSARRRWWVTESRQAQRAFLIVRYLENRDPSGGSPAPLSKESVVSKQSSQH